MHRMISRVKSEALFAERLNYIPDGVNSPVRAFGAVGGKTFFANKTVGCRVSDVDGNESIDDVARSTSAVWLHVRYWRRPGES